MQQLEGIVRVNKKEYQWIQMDSYVMYEENLYVRGFCNYKECSLIHRLSNINIF